MKTLKKILPLALSLSLNSGLWPYAPAEEPAGLTQQREQTEINPRNLPAKAQDAIFKHFHSGRVTKAYKLSKEGMVTGYLVEIKKGDETWTCEFDKEGKLISRNAGRGNL